MGPVILLSGVVLLVLGGAGMLGSASASHSRMRTTTPVVHVVQLGVGVLLGSAGAAFVFGG